MLVLSAVTVAVTGRKVSFDACDGETANNLESKYVQMDTDGSIANQEEEFGKYIVGRNWNCIQTEREEHNAAFSFAPESQAIIDMSMTGKHKLSPHLILFALKFYHASNEKIGNPASLINILSNYEPREDCDEEGDETLEAIVLYRLSICPSEAVQSNHWENCTLSLDQE